MALRKETTKEQFRQALAAELEAGEQIRTGLVAQSGPTPWMGGLVGVIAMLALGARPYFITLTDRRLVFMKASLMSGKPKGIAWADPLGAGTVTSANADAKLWSHFKYQRPDQSKVVRFNVHRVWRGELQELLGPVMGQQDLSVPPPPDAAAPA